VSTSEYVSGLPLSPPSTLTVPPEATKSMPVWIVANASMPKVCVWPSLSVTFGPASLPSRWIDVDDRVELSDANAHRIRVVAK